MLKLLRIKFICINMVIVTVMLTAIFGTVFHFTQTNLEQQSIQMMREALPEQKRPKPPFEGGQPMHLPHFVLRLDSSGNRVAAVSDYYDLTDEAFLDEVTAIVLNSERPTGVISQYDLRYLRDNGPHGQTLVFADMTTETNILTGLLRNCSIIALASFLIFLIISLYLARWAIRPVETAWQQQRQFVADASHELKTPLAVLMTNAELLQNSNCDTASQSRCLSNILTMTQQMRNLVERLLELTRADVGVNKSDVTDVDFSNLISDAVLPFEPLFFEHSLLLEEEIEPGLRLKGCLPHLRQLPDILLDNAMKYADPGTTVHIKLKRHGCCGLLSVSNFGSPIPPEELKNIFKRFYRVDKARTRDGSYGLGLAIAQSIVQSHHGRIWAESANGINTFFIQLPL